jgi:hypothetical protein
MVSQLQVIAIGIVGLIILVGISLVVLTKLSDSNAVCASGFTFITANQTCSNGTISVDTDPTNAGWVSIQYGVTQLGSTGLLSWLPAIIALLVGVFFLAYFAGGRGKGSNY